MLGDRFKKLRIEKGLSQKELAHVLDIAQSTIGMIETNRRELSNPLLIKVADYFDVTVDYLLGRSDYKKARILTAEELKTFLPEQLVQSHKLDIAVDGKELSEEDKEEIIKILKEKGFIK